MIKQKRSYAHIDNEGGSSNNSEDESSFKRQRNNSHSSNRSYASMNDDYDNDNIINGSPNSSVEMRIPYCLLLPNRAIGYVIGKSGSNVREIEKMCGAIIKCQKEFDVSVYPPPSEKILTIFGKKENKKKALELVLGKSKTVMDFQEEDGKESIVIIVPTRSIPIIIGQKGSKISALSEQSACEINVHKDDVPGIKDKAIFIKSKKISKIIDCIGIIYDLLEDIVENGILNISEFPGVPKNGNINSNNSNNSNNNNVLMNAPNGGHGNCNMSSVGPVGGVSTVGAIGGHQRGIGNNSGSSHNIVHNSSKYSSMKKNDNSFENFHMEEYDNFSVPREKNLLLHKLGKEVSSCVIRFVLDVETTAWIIGKAGCHIKEIRTITGAGAVIVDAPNNIENVQTCDRILTLSGSAENKYNALKLIVRQMEEREKNINNSMRMLVPGKAASFLIGRKGSIIKYITEQSGSQIQVAKNKESENEKLVLISGSPESKILASILVLQKLEEYDNPAIAREGLLIPLNDVYYNGNASKHTSMKKGGQPPTKGMHTGNAIRGATHKNSMHNDRYFASSSVPNHGQGHSGQNGHHSLSDHSGHSGHNGLHGPSGHSGHHNISDQNGHHSLGDHDNHNNMNDHHGAMDDGLDSSGFANYHYENDPPHQNLGNSSHGGGGGMSGISNNPMKNPNDMKDKVEKMFLHQIYKSFPISSLPKILSVKQPYTIELNMPDVYLETFDAQNKNGKSLIEEIIEKSGCNISICTDSNDSSSYTFNLSITGSPLSNSLAILMIQAKIFQFDWF
ncbi:RNA-binding protein, putative [Plasmodium ovale]|uniref:RNA-binding protein, putative n=1 Tax=Plasmodium ovale TaxID=36330 RepID=A0A1D3TJT6_PLAOA|nr:RNA-binding protein, putative [Plasmodium ovale]